VLNDSRIALDTFGSIMKSLMIWTRSVQPGQAPLENQLIGPDGLPIVKPPVLVLCLVIDAPEQLPPNSLWFTISICCVVCQPRYSKIVEDDDELDTRNVNSAFSPRYEFGSVWLL